MNAFEVSIYNSMPLSVDPKLRNQFSRAYAQMDKKKRIFYSPKDTKGPGLKRCNKCGRYYKQEYTILRKYSIDSERRYRYCLSCDKKLPLL